MAKIVAVRKDSEDKLSDFRLDDGRELNFSACYEAINRGEVEDVIATNGKEGVPVIRSLGDGNIANNLSQLPRF